MQPFDLRIDRCRAKSPCHKKDSFILQTGNIFIHELRSTAKRPYKIVETVPCLQMSHHFRSSAHYLEDYGNCPPVCVIVADGQRDALSVLIHSDDNKLPRLTGSGHTRCLHIHEVDVCRQFFVAPECDDIKLMHLTYPP